MQLLWNLKIFQVSNSCFNLSILKLTISSLWYHGSMVWHNKFYQFTGRMWHDMIALLLNLFYVLYYTNIKLCCLLSQDKLTAWVFYGNNSQISNLLNAYSGSDTLRLRYVITFTYSIPFAPNWTQPATIYFLKY